MTFSLVRKEPLQAAIDHTRLYAPHILRWRRCPAWFEMLGGTSLTEELLCFLEDFPKGTMLCELLKQAKIRINRGTLQPLTMWLIVFKAVEDSFLSLKSAQIALIADRAEKCSKWPLPVAAIAADPSKIYVRRAMWLAWQIIEG